LGTKGVEVPLFRRGGKENLGEKIGGGDRRVKKKSEPKKKKIEFQGREPQVISAERWGGVTV